MQLPAPRGDISAAVTAALLTDDPAALDAIIAAEISADTTNADADVIDDTGAIEDTAPNADPLADDDLQLALWVCYELHYRGFDDVAARWEWHPGLIAVRNRLEQQVLAALHAAAGDLPSGGSVAGRLRALVDADDGPSLARFMQQRGDRTQFAEFAIHRSVYQLKEADPHTWAIPRLAGAVKVALLEIQFDEYGSGDAARMHSELYRAVLRGLDLDDSYGAYVDVVPGITLAVGNVMTLFGLRRDLRGALVGHLAAYEMTSSAPCRRYARALRRLGGDDETCRFYDEHVVADALHEQLVLHDLCEALATAEPELADDILFGAAACLLVEQRFAAHLLDAWAQGRSSLRGTVLPVHSLPAAG